MANHHSVSTSFFLVNAIQTLLLSMVALLLLKCNIEMYIEIKIKIEINT